MADLRDGSGAGLLAFLDWASKKHEIRATTAHNLRVAVSNVLQVEDDPSTVQIADLDLDNLFRRFEVRSGSRYSSATIAAYKSRFRTAVTMYQAWLDQDASWNRVVRTRSTSSNAGGPPKKPGNSPTKQEVQRSTGNTIPPNAEQDQAAVALDRSAETVSYTLPLRPNLLVNMTLPIRLTTADADRIAAFVKSLAFDEAVSSSPDLPMRPSESLEPDG
ncbi:hypothetical protein ACQPZX_00510 [Actinoplanes sp. CA-142083]|uniref:hypothetical protein n=1 Tax=Actinoplanes sp. CA-142083 TaxID=3239903 RepID=UPI003D938E85